MITIEKIYDPKCEFKRLYESMRRYSHDYEQFDDDKETLEFCLTEVIDDYIAYWKTIGMSINTRTKLYLFAIVFRHNAVKGVSQ